MSTYEKPVETCLYWFTSRYYDSEIGRFISPDSIDYLDPESINGLNLYAYCGNDPINNYDPSGHFAITTLLISMAIGFGIGAGIGGATTLGIIGWVTTFAGVSSGLFASAEY